MKRWVLSGGSTSTCSRLQDSGGYVERRWATREEWYSNRIELNVTVCAYVSFLSSTSSEPIRKAPADSTGHAFTTLSSGSSFSSSLSSHVRTTSLPMALFLSNPIWRRFLQLIGCTYTAHQKESLYRGWEWSTLAAQPNIYFQHWPVSMFLV